MSYIENTWPEWGVEHHWHNANVRDSVHTNRGTHIEMVHRPNWGMACYMNNAIQSCESDEWIYHESLVHPVMLCQGKKDRVMIIGGGEGATAREVLKWPVGHVDMYEWDQEVVQLFQQKYPQWAKGAWQDQRLHIHHDDIMKRILEPPNDPYDVIVVDLFDPEPEYMEAWNTLLKHLPLWLAHNGSIVFYSGIHTMFENKKPYQIISEKIKYYMPSNTYEVIPYQTYIPSFSGQSVFLLVKPIETPIIFNFYHSAWTEDQWKACRYFVW